MIPIQSRLDLAARRELILLTDLVANQVPSHPGKQSIG